MTEALRAQPAYDAAGAEAFAERMAETVNAAAVAVMVSVGHRTGLFDTLSGMPPATSVEIAETAELSERYVREWLAAMVTGGIVRYDVKQQSYHLPPEHAACLTRAAPLGNFGVAANAIGLGRRG